MNDAAGPGNPEILTGGASLQRLFNDTRKRLVEIGTRNRLVHVNRGNTRGNVLNIVNERSDDVYAVLASGKAMQFRALGRDRQSSDPEPAQDPDQVSGGKFGDVAMIRDHDRDGGPGRKADTSLDSRLGPDALAKKLLKIAREAKTAEEEQGVNILYLALGFATWLEDKSSSMPREAPLVLIPVELVRNERTSTYDLRMRDDDIVTNLPLQQRWQEDFGIKLPEVDADQDGWRPSAYHDRIEAIIADRAGWGIDRDAMQLGFFSFSKLLMYRDLSLDSWPEDALERHELTRGLLYEGFDVEPPLFSEHDRLDKVLPPENLFHVVDADASQTRVIEEARAGRNLVVQGPPGTGKSQTITNIIAAAAKDGKTVLFVAEKMAALSVVHDRMVKVGLGDLTLELHSKSASKKAVLAELARTLNAGRAVPALPGKPEALRASRDRLNAIAEALHAPVGASGDTPYALLGTQVRYLGMGVAAPTLNAPSLSTMTRADENEACRLLAAFGAWSDRVRPAESHPFAGVMRLDLQPVMLDRLKNELRDAAVAIGSLRAALDAPLSDAGEGGPRSLATVPLVRDLLVRARGLDPVDAAMARLLLPTADPDRLREGLAVAASWRAARDQAEGTYVDAAYAADVGMLRGPLIAGAASFFARWGSAYRSASRTLAGLLREPLPKRAEERLALVDQLSEVQSLRLRWGEDEDFLARSLGDAWRAERTDFGRVAAVAAWAAQVRGAALAVPLDQIVAMASDAGRLAAQIAALDAALAPARERIDARIAALSLDESRLGGDQHRVDLALIARTFDDIAASTERYGEWAEYCRARDKLRQLGLEELAATIDDGRMDAGSAEIELKYARAERLWETSLAANPVLGDIARMDRDALVAEFVDLERVRLKDSVTSILASHLAQVPQGALGEMRVIRGEIGKKQAHIALRRLFKQAPNALQRIKPVLLMSPISVAQFLTPGVLSFDLLVIDEASQVRPEDALGAIARAKQIVVVGDQKQLPPSSFFDRLLSDGDDDIDEENGEHGPEDLLGGAASAGNLESILTLCEARGLPSRMLQWHYRSRDPSLMRVSNAEFYRHELVLPPSPLEMDTAFGLIFTRVDGVYDKGGRRDNRIEGQAIVQRVAEHARRFPDQSIGIVTFSHAQKNVITELLDEARRTDTVLDGFLREGRHEDHFVKNIENVQGDERDVILISVGYGPAVPGGRMIGASFGPVNGEGGERRLNVLFTRARLRCEVFASFDPAELDVSRASRDGPRVLKRFLDYAKSGQMHDAEVTGEPADSAFEEDVADVIRSLGYIADPQVGSAGFRIDIGVRHPDRPGAYLLAVECDGATYHSALWARERDRLRQDVLEHLGWRFHRIWSTDWFYDRRSQIDRLRRALDAARDGEDAGTRISGANRGVHREPVERSVDTLIPPPPEIVERVMPAYLRAYFPIHARYEPHEMPMTQLAPLVVRIIEAEGPIHAAEIARRVAGCFGRERAGSRIIAATGRALERVRREQVATRCEEDFWCTAGQALAPPVRDRSGESGVTLKAEAISQLEIRAALAIARDDNAGGADADLIRAAARLLGFRRVGPDLQARISVCLD